MKKTLYTLGMATILLTGVTATSFATGAGAAPSQAVTGVQTGSQQLSTPATGAQVPASTYGMNGTGGANTNAGPGGPDTMPQSSPDASHPTVAKPNNGDGK